MRPVATDVARSVVSVGHMGKRTAEPMEMPFGGQTWGPKNLVLDGEKIFPREEALLRALRGHAHSALFACRRCRMCLSSIYSRRMHLPSRGVSDKTSMRPFVKNYLGYLL